MFSNLTGFVFITVSEIPMQCTLILDTRYILDEKLKRKFEFPKMAILLISSWFEILDSLIP